MKSLILVAVILQLVIIGIKTDQNYQFGDIIELPKKCRLYSHYAIYVGKGTNVAEWRDVGQDDNDIFHRLGKGDKEIICEFGKLDETRKKFSTDKKKNYLDHKLPDIERTTDKIKERIEQKNNECGKYKVFKNNCEHLATYVRYGISRSLQKGTPAVCIFKPIDLARNGFQSLVSETHKLMDHSEENNNLPPCEDEPN